jgi:rhamnose transport system permease protein
MAESLRVEKYNRFLHPEYGTILMLIASIILGSVLSPYFRDVLFVFDSSSLYIEYGIIALILTFVIISGQIDLSIASTMALVACFTATLYEMGIPFVITIVIGLASGLLLGLLNGYIITRFSLPPIIVTIGTLSLFRGFAQVLLGDHSIGHFPDWFVGIDMKYIGFIPFPLIIFCGLFIVMAIVLNRTIFGRQIYAVGTNEKAAAYSGINVKKIKMILFALSGLFSAFGGIMMISRLGIARYNLAMGGELEIVTIALLGGADINGGRGNVIGTFIAFFVLVCLKTGLSVANIKIENQLAILGSLLIFSIVLSNYIYSKRK